MLTTLGQVENTGSNSRQRNFTPARTTAIGFTQLKKRPSALGYSRRDIHFTGRLTYNRTISNGSPLSTAPASCRYVCRDPETEINRKASAGSMQGQQMPLPTIRTRSKYRTIRVGACRLFDPADGNLVRRNERGKRRLERLLRRINRIATAAAIDEESSYGALNRSTQQHKKELMGRENPQPPLVYPVQLAKTRMKFLKERQLPERGKDLETPQLVKGRAVRGLKKGERGELPVYKDRELELLVNNDVSVYNNKPLTMKEQIILDSMKQTFACSRFLRFQRLLNVFEDS